MSKIETTYQQKVFIKDKLKPMLQFMKALTKKPETITHELIRENGEYKNYIGIDLTFKKGKDKNLTITLFWGKYEKLNNEDDYYDLIDSCPNEDKIILKKDFDIDKTINQVTTFFDDKLKTI